MFHGYNQEDSLIVNSQNLQPGLFNVDFNVDDNAINDDAINVDTMLKLGDYFRNKQQLSKAKEYYIMAIQHNNSQAKINIKYITTPLERYILYKKNGIKFDEILTSEINIYNDKIK